MLLKRDRTEKVVAFILLTSLFTLNSASHLAANVCSCLKDYNPYRAQNVLCTVCTLQCSKRPISTQKAKTIQRQPSCGLKS